MKAKLVTLEFLIDRHLARRLAERLGDTKPEGLFLLVQSLLAAAIVNPLPVVKHLRKFEYLDRQLSTQRGLIRPRVISITCGDNGQRQALCRTMLAVTAAVAAALDGSVLPDPTTVLAALLELWVVEKETPKGKQAKAAPQPMEAIARPAKRFRRDNLPPLFPKKKAAKGKSRRGQVHAHPEFPDVKKLPIRWRPGTPGRPPKGACCDERGLWTPPAGFRVIRGLWHEPIEPREALSQSTEALSEGEENPAHKEGTAGEGDPDIPVPRPAHEPGPPSPAGTAPGSPQDRSGVLPRSTCDQAPNAPPDGMAAPGGGPASFWE